MYDFVDPSFSKEISHLYSLSIQVSLNGFSFCVRNDQNAELKAFKHFPAKISNENLLTRRMEEWFSEEEMLQLSYREKTVFISFPKFSLVPGKLESEDLKSDLLKLLLKSDDESEQAENWIDPLQAKLIFLLPPNFLRMLSDSFGDFKLSHVLQPVLGLLFKHSSECTTMLLFDDKEMYISIKENGQLLLCNVFHINHTNDAIYYVLSAAKQFKLNTGESVLLLAGKSSWLYDLETQFSKHFKQIIHADTEKPSGDLNQRTVSEFVCLW